LDAIRNRLKIYIQHGESENQNDKYSLSWRMMLNDGDWAWAYTIYMARSTNFFLKECSFHFAILMTGKFWKLKIVCCAFDLMLIARMSF
jgi:hypothetical protein